MEEETLSRVVQKDQANPLTSRNNTNSPTFNNNYDCGGGFDMFNFVEENNDSNIPSFSNSFINNNNDKNNNNTYANSSFGFSTENGANTSAVAHLGMPMLEESGYKFSSGYDDDEDE